MASNIYVIIFILIVEEQELAHLEMCRSTLFEIESIFQGWIWTRISGAFNFSFNGLFSSPFLLLSGNLLLHGRYRFLTRIFVQLSKQINIRENLLDNFTRYQLLSMHSCKSFGQRLFKLVLSLWKLISCWKI